MKWFKRGLWLAAWCVWLWLGFGLYRELPRDLGPRVCKIPVLTGDQVHGFLEGRYEVLVGAIDFNFMEKVYSCDVFDATTGTHLRSVRGKARELEPSIIKSWLRQAGGPHFLKFDESIERLNLNLPARWQELILVYDSSGEFIRRAWHHTFVHSYESSDRKLAADKVGNIFVAPAINYPLLALCQTILALPLILLWALLRWHRNRRFRLASVTP